MTNLCDLNLFEAANLIATKQLSPLELTNAFLERIAALNDALHAFLLVTSEQAIFAARAAETQIVSGQYRSALHGIPIGIKDIFDTAGTPTTAQSRLLQQRVPSEDATVVKRLYDGGAIILLAESFAFHEQDLRQQPELYGEYSRFFLKLGAFISSSDYLQAVRCRRELCFEVEQAMAGIDVLVTATELRAAPKFTELPQFLDLDSPSLTVPFNVTELPALAICCGFNANSLPLSMQIIGKAFDEVTVLAVGNAYEQATPWHQYRPNLKHSLNAGNK